MPALYDRWVAAKKKFLDSNLRTADVPPEFVMQLSRGADLGPSLKTFEKADGFEGRKKAIVDVLRAKDEYDRAMSSAVRATSNQAAKNAIETLHKSLLSIWVEVEAATQPPRPSGQMVKYETLQRFSRQVRREIRPDHHRCGSGRGLGGSQLRHAVDEHRRGRQGD
jgi:hypothetical protein